jgi:Ca-activated chloride channel family protein
VVSLKHFSFGQPWWLLLLLPLIYWAWQFGEAGVGASLTHSSTALLTKLAKPRRLAPGRILWGLRFLALALLVLALARPRLPQGERKDPTKGIDIMLCLDCSGSMDQQDFTIGARKVSRREALVRAMSEFVDARKNDRFGMVGFAANTYILSPLTTDANWIKDVFKYVKLKDGTAIGDGIITGVNKLEENSGRSKVMVVVTDGENNTGANPVEAADYAKQKNIRVYTLQIVDLKNIRSASASKHPLAQVATKTGGQFFQASDTGSLLQIYHQIDRMEKREIEDQRFMLFHELFGWFLAAGALLLLLEFTAAHTFWHRAP